MKVIDRYIAKTVILDTLMVLFSLMLLRTLFAFIDESSDIGKGDYQFIDALYFSTLQLPARLYELFPVSALIGGLVGIGRLASNSELIVMRASGLSLKDISFSVLKGTITLMIIVFFVGEFITPKSSPLARQMQTLLISGGNLVNSSQGVWVKESNNYIHIRILLQQGRMEGVTRFQFSNEQLQAMIYAQTATYQENGRWLLEGVKQTFVSKDSVRSTEADSLYWDTEITPETLGVVSLNPEELNIQGLVEYRDYLRENGLNSTRYELAYWKKILQPLAVAVMMFLALSFISGPLRTVTIGARIVLGMVVGYGFNMLSNIFGPVSLIYQMPPILAASLPIILFGVIAAIMLKQAR
ncbi:MAG: lipopolysaccharide ABC transporter permease LptG [Gammaproteobacteria bacterium]|nr:MAG: lipopolysaccharide ABC transporter permease LptG [Gammaproteobacteria bacterium]PCJ48428.1 MAG: lipopolysaccharide ABC transporter permease LptG [Gammaproteobacteria bacterium]